MSEYKLGDDAVITVEWPEEGRGRPRERREGVEDAITTDWTALSAWSENPPATSANESGWANSTVSLEMRNTQTMDSFRAIGRHV